MGREGGVRSDQGQPHAGAVSSSKGPPSCLRRALAQPSTQGPLQERHTDAREQQPHVWDVLENFSSGTAIVFQTGCNSGKGCSASPSNIV
jgi:hypothetical protein